VWGNSRAKSKQKIHRNPNPKSIKIQDKHKKIHRKSKQQIHRHPKQTYNKTSKLKQKHHPNPGQTYKHPSKSKQQIHENPRQTYRKTFFGLAQMDFCMLKQNEYEEINRKSVLNI
jgi:hypothetical protein